MGGPCKRGSVPGAGVRNTREHVKRFAPPCPNRTDLEQSRAQTVRTIDAWYTAFDVKPGDKLYLAPEKRVKIWG